MKIIQNICSFKLLLKFALKQYIVVVVVVNGLCQVKLKSLFFFLQILLKIYLLCTLWVLWKFPVTKALSNKPYTNIQLNQNLRELNFSTLHYSLYYPHLSHSFSRFLNCNSYMFISVRTTWPRNLNMTCSELCLMIKKQKMQITFFANISKF